MSVSYVCKEACAGIQAFPLKQDSKCSCWVFVVLLSIHMFIFTVMIISCNCVFSFRSIAELCSVIQRAKLCQTPDSKLIISVVFSQNVLMVAKNIEYHQTVDPLSYSAQCEHMTWAPGLHHLGSTTLCVGVSARSFCFLTADLK